MVFLCNWLNAQQHNKEILFENVSVFDGKNELILTNQHVLISGNKIALISKTALPKNDNMIVIDGKGKTLIPGLIDVHVHMIFGALSMKDMMDPNLKPENLLMKVVPEAKKMLLRGFTSVRDVGGPSFQLKQSIDDGTIQGPRIWPSGAMISQTSGHGDLRLPEERSRRFFGPISKAENFGASFIADGTAEVLTAVRENLRFGASQIKLMAGGGTSSAYDPVDVTQYTLEEMKAAVEAAEDWGTYVTVHAYTPRAVRKAIDAGVKCIEHGQLLDKSTLKLIKRKGIWLSCQNLIDNTPEMSELRKEKRKPVVDGQKMIWPLAKKMKIKLAWGTDFLFEPWLNEEQNSYLLKLKEWFTPYEILKMVTHDNAQLLSLSGNRSPYPGELGVIKQGALADLILIDGNPLEDIDLIAQPNDKFLVILKDGRVEKNLLE
ncbi:amidohydrolase family protein [Flavobacterium tibetense]|uniref:Amidohydrolase family protein n=2 Tax=Flavobacterium tibetense TaxID=2233533 RepID=A0A365P217_9FLAO|nr:amidohydrolase family protein [Flavobacterium tibetense]